MSQPPRPLARHAPAGTAAQRSHVCSAHAVPQHPGWRASASGCRWGRLRTRSRGALAPKCFETSYPLFSLSPLLLGNSLLLSYDATLTGVSSRNDAIREQLITELLLGFTHNPAKVCVEFAGRRVPTTVIAIPLPELSKALYMRLTLTILLTVFRACTCRSHPPGTAVLGTLVCDKITML